VPVPSPNVITLAHLPSVFGHGQHHDLMNTLLAYTIYTEKNVRCACLFQEALKYAGSSYCSSPILVLTVFRDPIQKSGNQLFCLFSLPFLSFLVSLVITFIMKLSHKTNQMSTRTQSHVLTSSLIRHISDTTKRASAVSEPSPLCYI
jgi:hypothetical protein